MCMSVCVCVCVCVLGGSDLLTMSSAEASAPSAGRQAGQGRSLWYPRHGSLALHRHLQVFWERLAASQHLIGHDLRPQLVQLALVEGRRC